MPYFIYRITPPDTFEHLDTKEKYKDAKTLVTELRAGLPDGSEDIVRMIFAKNTMEAVKLLARPPEHEGKIIGDD